MPVITISRESYSPGKEVAERVAERLGFECVSGDVLSEASEEYDVPESQLLRAVRDTLGQIPGLKKVHVDLFPITTPA